MSVVTKTVKRKLLFSWNINFDYTMEVGKLNVWVHPDENTMIRVELTDVSTDELRKIRKQILDWMEQDITLSGIVMERWEKQKTSKTEEREEWVQTYP